MVPRMSGELTSYDTRHDSHEKVDKQKRYKQILECFTEHPTMTAKECADYMQRKGYIPTNERNFTAPRMTEMSQNGIIEPVGKKKCAWTGKMVAVYGLRG